MKKNILVAILIIALVSLFWNVPRIKYDLNRDGKINTADIVKVTNYYLKK